MRRALDLADLPFWAACRDGRDTCRARLCFGPGARLITWLARAEGLVLGRRVFLSPSGWVSIERGSPGALALLEHELVHVEQFRRLGFFGFMYRYLRDYFVGRWRGKGHSQAYRDIDLEVEARELAARRLAELLP